MSGIRGIKRQMRRNYVNERFRMRGGMAYGSHSKMLCRDILESDLTIMELEKYDDNGDKRR